MSPQPKTGPWKPALASIIRATTSTIDGVLDWAAAVAAKLEGDDSATESRMVRRMLEDETARKRIKEAGRRIIEGNSAAWEQALLEAGISAEQTAKISALVEERLRVATELS